MEPIKSAYWDRYYAGATTVSRPVPSQFAVFVAGELAEPCRIVEFGCGTGRDSLFFATYGHQVIAIDGSAAAIERASAVAVDVGEKIDFRQADVATDIAATIPQSGGRTVIYARFFVHAISEDEQSAFLQEAAALTRRGDLLAVEYRTIRDRSGEKETGAHYRRFVDPVDFDQAAAGNGFRVTYAVEGFGFAKYKSDDAYVARRLLERG